MIPELLVDAMASELSRPFWEATRAGRLALQRCSACGRFQHPPRALCVVCGAADADLSWEVVSGTGVIYAFSVVRRALIPALDDHVPYVLAVIELEEGVRITSLIRGCDKSDLRIGAPVEVAFEVVTPEVTLPVFRPAA